MSCAYCLEGEESRPLMWKSLSRSQRVKQTTGNISTIGICILENKVNDLSQVEASNSPPGGWCPGHRGRTSARLVGTLS